MAQDLPEYQRRQAIQPAGSSGSFTAGLSGVAEADMTIVGIGSQLAQNAANERARLAGIEAGQTPGQKLFPAFTESDKAFVQAYKQEEYNTLLYQGQKYLNESLFTALKDPSGESLNAYQDNAEEALKQLTSQSQADLSPELKRSLSQMYESNYYKLANAVERKNHEFLLSNFKAGYNAGLENTYNFQMQGNHVAAQDSYAQELANIEGALSQGLITPDVAREMRNEAVINNQSAYYQFKGLSAQDDKQGEAFLKNLTEHPPEHLTPLQQQQVLSKTANFMNQRQSYLQGQQYIDFIGAQARYASGALSAADIPQLKQDLSAQDFAKLELQMARDQTEDVRVTHLLNKMRPDFSNPAALSQYSGSDVDSVFGRLVSIAEGDMSRRQGQPYKASLLDKAMIAQEIQAPIASLSQSLGTAIQYDGVDGAVEAARAIRLLQHNNPLALKGMDTASKAVANLFDLYTRNTGYTPEESLKAARDEVFNVDDNTKTQRTEAYKAWKTGKDLNLYQNKMNFVAKGLGATSGLLYQSPQPNRLPAGIGAKFDELMASMVKRVPNPALAAEMVFDELKEVYKPTRINNRDEIMALAPESVLPNEVWAQNDKLRALKQLVDRNEVVRQQGGFVMSELAWPDAPALEDLLSKSLIEGDVKIQIDGTPRKIVVVSDAITQLSKEGQPTWAFAYVDDSGQEIPIMDAVSQNAVARWVPDYAGLGVQYEKYRARQRHQAEQSREKTLKVNKLVTDLALERD